MIEKEIDRDEAGTLVDSRVADASSWFSSKLSKERAEVLRYYNRLEPAPRKGSSSYVSPDVYHGVEMMRAQIGEVFSAGTGVVRFDAYHAEDIEPARIQSEYTDYVFYRKNNGQKMIRDALFDGFTSRIAIAKVFWNKETHTVEREFDNKPPMLVEAWKQNPQVGAIVGRENPDGTISGKLTLKIDVSYPRVELVCPEDFVVEARATELTRETFCAHITMRPLSWIEENYPKARKLLKDKNPSQHDPRMTDQDKAARFEATDTNFRLGADDGMEPSYRIDEAYAKFKLKGDLTAQLYRVVRCAGITLEMEPVDDHPFVAFVPLPMPHALYGSNFAQTIIPTQKAQTAITRTILDHAAITSNPRWMVAGGGLTNPRELLDNRLGGIVNVRSLDAIAPLPKGELNPSVFNLQTRLDLINQKTTGITEQMQGISKDSISTPNAAAMEAERSAGMTRGKEIARIFADQFLTPLFVKLSNIIAQYEKGEKQIEVTGGFLQIDFNKWIAGRTASASVHLGIAEKKAAAAELTQMGAAMMQHPILSQMVGPEQAYNMAVDLLILGGQKNNINRYLMTPDKVQPPQPDPTVMAEAALKQAQAQAITMKAEADIAKVKLQAETKTQQAQIKVAQAQSNEALAASDDARKWADVENRIDIAQREMALAEDAPSDLVNAIVSPN